ncbi:hypothetical protein [Eudoraea adriatica]|uniref:hypothetical protein n=1 Tax=Eudoraea adriatica TaxID=446681 RepID=UPI0012FB178D|nr:hypothetical protein [Eudoraea adriatica]
MKIVQLLFFGICSIGFTQYNGNALILSHGQLELAFYEAPTVGSQYLNEIYQEGTAIIDSSKEENRLMRYNAYTDEMEFLSKEQKPLRLLKRENIEVILNGKKYQVLFYNFKNKIAKGYFNPLNEGEVVLYLQPKKRLSMAEAPDNGYDDLAPAKYENKFEYYLKNGDKPITKVEINRKAILNQLGDRREAIKRYIKENKLRLSKLEDVIEVLNYYNGV